MQRAEARGIEEDCGARRRHCLIVAWIGHRFNSPENTGPPRDVARESADEWQKMTRVLTLGNAARSCVT